jgi:NarL family two-component system response regulator LiaR
VVDDDPFARRAMVDALRPAGIHVVAEAQDGPEAIALAREHRPDVVLMDIRMPGMDGIAATRRIVRERPEQVVILVSTANDEELAVLGIRVGAAGFITKDVEVDTLPEAVAGAARGEPVMPRTLTRRLIEQVRMGPIAGEGLRPVYSSLTKREWEVLDLLCQDRTTEEIAGLFVVSTETVRSHVKRILHKLGVNSRADAVAAAHRIRGVES